MSCICPDGPTPRILEASGRQFCAVCRRYLDKAPVDTGPRSDDSTDDAQERASSEEGDS